MNNHYTQINLNRVRKYKRKIRKINQNRESLVRKTRRTRTKMRIQKKPVVKHYLRKPNWKIKKLPSQRSQTIKLQKRQRKLLKPMMMRKIQPRTMTQQMKKMKKKLIATMKNKALNWRKKISKRKVMLNRRLRLKRRRKEKQNNMKLKLRHQRAILIVLCRRMCIRRLLKRKTWRNPKQQNRNQIRIKKEKKKLLLKRWLQLRRAAL